MTGRFERVTVGPMTVLLDHEAGFGDLGVAYGVPCGRAFTQYLIEHVDGAWVLIDSHATGDDTCSMTAAELRAAWDAADGGH